MANNFESKFTTLKAFMKDDVNLRLGPDNKTANSGEQAYKDIIRSTFIINGKEISKGVVEDLYKNHQDLEPNSEDIENKDYRPFAREIFKGMFIDANAHIPTYSILEEIVTNCNQAGYEGVFFSLSYGFSKHGLTICPSDRKIYINCKNSNSIDFECSSHAMSIKDPDIQDSENNVKVCDASFLIKFTLESDEDKTRYRNGEMRLAFPKELKKYRESQTNKNLIDVIKEIFCELVEKFFSRCQIEEEGNIVKMTSKLKDGPLNNLLEKTTNNRHDAKNGTTEVTNKLKNSALSSVLEDVQPLTNNNRFIEK